MRPTAILLACLASVAPAAPAVDPLAIVDPELRRAAQVVAKLPPMTQQPARPRPPAPLPDGVAARSIAGRAGDPPVPVYLIRPAAGDTPLGAILFIHGGGFISGDARAELRRLKAMAERLGCVIASVEYRLAPATRFPGPMEDAYAALAWLHRDAAALGIDPRRIVVLGESAGGGLAAMVAIAARDRGTPIALTAMVYPMLDDRTGSSRPTPAHIGQLIWRADDNRRGWSALLGRPAGSTRVPAGAVPAREATLAGLSPAFIEVGSIDLFAAEDIDYARRLVEAGVPTELLVVPGGFHGFQMFAPKAAVSRRFNAALEDALARALAAPVAASGG